MKLTDERIDQIITAFAQSHTNITPDFAKDLAEVSESYDVLRIMGLYTKRKEDADNELPPVGFRG